MISNKTKDLILYGLVILTIILAYLLGQSNYKLSEFKIASNLIQTSPTPTSIIVASTTPTTIPTNINNQTASPKQPSDRSLKVAGAIYSMYRDEESRIKIREKAGMSKSDENTEIIQLAIWLDKNLGYLAKVEASIENYKTQQTNTKIDLSSEINLKPLTCTTSTLGNSTYTNCY